ncbi:hypothetical protein JTE90_019258 [Oedothorax gibbosus]|uniref:Uncharacterized protein n=1 Tax=Oedothorax gibbosus TaxID=931172 RepID=A0AAV6UTJ2_9ARAC|nr:hypothetical protein JTE90_019258 [Oedothorax gibbosus]
MASQPPSPLTLYFQVESEPQNKKPHPFRISNNSFAHLSPPPPVQGFHPFSPFQFTGAAPSPPRDSPKGTKRNLL